ncbi:alpha-L-fucosidase [Sphingobacterium faecium]|uniref:alpha-L-fucosidase n=1 Tax=Sphingobacterium faecium TaxID=34087 RepID=UPI00097EF583|nr:alpha-L-fucosidase [Sphingobacterium faecium]WGQ16340.1 alpha-L-fucosidase [Sphingobacterium faecium]SJN30243.1 Alpha-L-fucosidase [Sphingobacterium faecium PCAi_F2.5]
MMKSLKRILFAFCLFFIFTTALFAQQNSKTQWFSHDRFGMFIHWGLYSAAEGLWKGEKLRYANNYAEWLRYRNRVSKEEYGELAKRFVWDQINPEEWVLLAKKAGMKYIIMTAKHHDGVAIWDTKIGDYSLSRLSGTNRDIIKELAIACKKHDMKLGFYYSHWIDWEHPYAWNHNQELTGHVTDQQYNQYWQEKVIPQLRELLTNYGDIALMWFDMWIPYEKSIIKKQQLQQVVQLIHNLQPKCLINSRLGLPTDEKNIDFETFGDNQFGTTYVDHPWETPGTIAHSWGYNGQENEWKSTSQIFNSLISNVSLNGGYTLNIGPRADGTLPYESISRLEDIGKWLQRQGESIYGATGLDLRVNQHDWGYLTTKTHGKQTQVYAQVFNWPLDRILRISGIKSKPSQVSVRIGASETSLKFKQKSGLLHIQLPAKQPDPFVSTISLTYNEPLQLDKEIVAESTFGGFALNSTNALHQDKLQITKYDGKRPQHIQTNNETIEWMIDFPEVGVYKVDISAHNPNKIFSTILIQIGTQSITEKLDSNGKLVVEPNENNYTDEFVNTSLGSIKIDHTGPQKISFKKEGSEHLWLNSIWIEKKN